MTVAGWPITVRRFPRLMVSTPRLLLRGLGPEDAATVADVFADPRTQRWLPVPQEYGPVDGLAWCTELASERRDLGDGDHYGVVRREDNKVVGCVWTRRTDWVARSTEASVAVAAEARGFGVAGEAIDALAIALLCEHGFERVELRVAAGNAPCRRVAEKAGFTFEGLLRNAGHVYIGRTDVEVWSLVSADLKGAVDG